MGWDVFKQFSFTFLDSQILVPPKIFGPPKLGSTVLDIAQYVDLESTTVERVQKVESR